MEARLRGHALSARDAVKHPFLRHGLRVFGVGLIVWMLWLVGWDDRLDDGEGTEWRGLIVRIEGEGATLRTDDGKLIDGDKAKMHVGLRHAVHSLGRRPGTVLLAVALQLAGLLIIQVRWRILLLGAGLRTRWRTVFRIGFVGLFFQNLLPGGATSGDLMRAVYVTRTHPEQKTRAVVTIFVDRAIGLLTLFVIASSAILFVPREGALAEARGIVFACLAAGLLVLAVIYIPPLHRAMGVGKASRRVPLLKHVAGDIAAAFSLYRERPGPVLLAFFLAGVGHTALLACYYFYGVALGWELSLLAVAAAIPVAQVISAVPGLPAGFGIGDAAFLYFLGGAGVPAGTALAISFTFRIVAILFSLPGGLVLLPVPRAP